MRAKSFFPAAARNRTNGIREAWIQPPLRSEKRVKNAHFWLFFLQKRGCLFTFSLPADVTQTAHKELFTIILTDAKSANFEGVGGEGWIFA
jgi:hypothetical protein